MAVHDVPLHPSVSTNPSEPQSGAHPLPLANGDRLTRQEFEHRYSARSDIKKAELIEGVVSAVTRPLCRSWRTARCHSDLAGDLLRLHPRVRAADNATIRLDLDNEPQPDALLRLEPDAGGRSRLSEDDYVEGAPELIVEIAASSATYDLHDKLRAYRRNGVQEYLVWRVYEKQFDWFVLVDDEYRPLTADAAGRLHRRVFPGLRLAVAALLAGDTARVLAALQTGVGTPEHAAFVERVRAKGE